MLKNNLLLKKSIDTYLKTFFNLQIYKELTSSDFFFEIFNVCDFFDKLWHMHTFVISNKSKPIELLNYLLSDDLTDLQKYFFFHKLYLSFNRYSCPDLKTPYDDIELNIFLDLLHDHILILSRSLAHDTLLTKSIYNFELISLNLFLIENDFEKLKFLFSIKSDYLNFIESNPNFIQNGFDRKCDIEISKIKKRIKLNSIIASQNVKSASQNPDSIKEFIRLKFIAYSPLGWTYFFKTEYDFNFFCTSLTNYFLHIYYDAVFSISLHDKCKTKLCECLNAIHSEFHFLPLKEDLKFLFLIKNLSPFQALSTDEIYMVLRKR